MGAADRPWLLRGAVLGLTLVVALVAWIASGDDEEAAAPVVEAEPRIVAVEELEEVAVGAEYPLYWAGAMPGAALELTESETGIQLRYLDEGAGVGEESAAFFTVGSYPLADPTGALDALAAEPGAIVRRSPDGRRVVTRRENPNSVYFASPDNSVQVEVYDPSPQRAMALALSELVRPIG